MITSYFKVYLPGALLDGVFPFDDTDPASALAAFARACELRDALDQEAPRYDGEPRTIVIWRPAKVAGPWSSCPPVGKSTRAAPE